MQRHSFLRGGLALAMAACLAGSALAQGKPATLRFLVPYPAGGAADQITRLVANDASIILGTPIVIENKGGAAGMIAAELALRAEPDGATFYVGANAPMVINQAIYDKMPYDPAKDFVPVAGMGKAPLLLVTRKDLGAPTLPALIALAKKDPGRITMGSASSGNITHLAGEHAASQMGFKVTHVPFAGSAPAITSMMGGNVDIMFDALPSCMQQAKAGRIVPLALMDGQRFPQLPQIPTMEELGYKGLVASAWFGVMARTGTPQPAIDALNKAINEALRKPELIEKLRNIGAQPMPGTQQQFAQFITAERQQWMPLAKALGVKAD
ncbi:Bug family tripartite tricarboxylate transporter substrate binding protein [Paenacidovorax monticola]|uniref:Tripartite tricarboxylate transporter substrate binding protein n=1 Tax=Paenacidovorax monticola TaxID=1926868 RepID=A0A7H0HJG7_9BURK|nr:tripartite tricarboxylate transporter substrate binding protein [Paenacidovorax monticola]QNP60683.1 tripartite tricarboxylate transporter substrate binding protein [Paenacidovorax monticola]